MQMSMRKMKTAPSPTLISMNIGSLIIIIFFFSSDYLCLRQLALEISKQPGFDP